MSCLPHVSVVVPVRNGAATIDACLEALLRQDYPRELLEILVVENRSTDDTAARAAAHPVALLNGCDLLTSYAARNRGVGRSGGEIVAFTDADCIPSPDWLKHLIAPFTDPSVAAVAGAIEDAPFQSVCEEFAARVQPFARPRRGGLATILTANVAIRRSALEAVGHFDEQLPTGGDVDLGWRLQQEGFAIREAPRASVAHRHRATFAAAFAQYRRYGVADVLLATIHRDAGHSLPLAAQLWRTLDQLRAMAVSAAALIFRFVVSIARGFDRRYVLWPYFLFVIESGNVLGRITGLALTRGCRKNPFPNIRLGRSA